MPLEDDFNPVEAMAQLKAEFDQAVESMRELARAVRAYYEGLVEAGFTEDEALTLAAKWAQVPRSED